MCFWKKKQIVEPPKPAEKKYKKVIKYRDEKFKIGRTWVEITFDDATTFKTLIYGSFHQSIDNGYKDRECRIRGVLITNSLKRAEWQLTSLLDNNVQTFVNDPKNTKVVVKGKAIRAEILNSEPYEETFQVAYIEIEEVKE